MYVCIHIYIYIYIHMHTYMFPNWCAGRLPLLAIWGRGAAVVDGHTGRQRHTYVHSSLSPIWHRVRGMRESSPYHWVTRVFRENYVQYQEIRGFAGWEKQPLSEALGTANQQPALHPRSNWDQSAAFPGMRISLLIWSSEHVWLHVKPNSRFP